MSRSRGRVLGLVLAGVGAAHFVVPAAFEPVSRKAFPRDTRRWVVRNGVTEVALGLAIAGRRTRRVGVLGLAGYGAWLGARVLRR